MSRRASAVRWLGHKAWFARFVRLVVVPLDTILGRATKGRILALGRRELPTLMITTIGRKSGKRRSVPLLYAPDDEGYVVIGSNFGQAHHPGWSANLLANPSATVQVDGATVRVKALYARGAERERLLNLLIGYWPAYQTYELRAATRELRVFRLTPEVP